MNHELSALLDKGAMELVNPVTLGFYFIYFLEEMKDSRLCLLGDSTSS